MAAAAVIQRPFRGSRVSTFYPVKTLPPLSSLDSAFQLQEYISLLIRHDVHDVERIVALPGKQTGKESEEGSEVDKNEDKEVERARGDVVVDEACWIYEQLRRLAQDLTHPLITMLQQECSRSTCPEMKAGEWLYLCVAHGTDGAMEQCCAIDYILHTLDSATALLNSPRAFPSRLQIPSASHRHFSSLARRLGRIFAHAYFHHRDIFAQAEAESSLYARFLALTSRYDLVPADFIVIPSTKVVTSDGEGDEGDIPRDAGQKMSIVISDASDVQPPRLLAASIDPQGDREMDKLVPRPTSAPPTNAAFNPTSVRIIGNRNNKTRNPPGLFVSGNGLIPVSSAATAAPTTAASLFESTETPMTTIVGQSSPQPQPPSTLGPGAPTLAPGQESPRKIGRPRTDTMIYSEDPSSSSSGEGGRGTSPIPVVRLGARLNEPEHPQDVATGETQEHQLPIDVEPTASGTDIPTQSTEEPEPFVVPEILETGHTAAVVGEEAHAEEADVPAADFEPIDDEVVVIGPSVEEAEAAVTEHEEEQKQNEEPHDLEAATSESGEPAHVEEHPTPEEESQVEEHPTPEEEESQVEKPEATSSEITEGPNDDHPEEAVVSGEDETPPEQGSVPEAEDDSHDVAQADPAQEEQLAADEAVDVEPSSVEEGTPSPSLEGD